MRITIVLRIAYGTGLVFGICLSVDGHICQKDATEYISSETDDTLDIYARFGHYADLQCCGAGVKWYKWGNSTSHWAIYVPYNDGKLSPSFEENAQILAFKSAQFQDEGKYKCERYLNHDQLCKRVFSLKVEACDELARGPYPIAPLPCERTYIDLHTTLTLPCAGYFGCGGDEMRGVKWYVREGIGRKWKPASRYDVRYKEVTFSRGGVELGANLTISDIQTDDLARDFMCLLTTPQIVQGESELYVRLINKGHTDVLPKPKIASASVNVIYLAIVAAVVLVFGVVIIAMAIISRTTKLKHRSRRTDKESNLLNSESAVITDV